MDTVFLLEHVCDADREDESVKTIGVYRTRGAAQAAIDRLGGKPGFRNYPEGWVISAKRLDQDSWSEGFSFDDTEGA